MKKLFYSKALIPVWTLIFSAVFGYSMYSFSYEFLDWSDLLLVGLYSVLSGLCFGGVFLLLYAQKKENGRIPAFFAALAAFEIVLWAVLTLVNVDGLYNRRAVNVAFAILLAAFGIICFLALFNASKERLKAVNGVLAVILCIGFCIAAASPVLPSKKDIYYSVNYIEKISFSPITADEVKVSDRERVSCSAWFDNHVLSFASPAFDFSVDGEKFSENTGKWTVSKTAVSQDEEKSRGGRSFVLTASNGENAVTLRVEGTYYENSATCEWTVYLKNEGEDNSPVISDFFALSGSVPADNADIYCAKGSDNSAADFTLMKIKNPSKAHVFSGTGGRPSDEYMPYFNISGKTSGAVLAIGWTGQWKTELKQNGDNTVIQVGQESFSAYLEPGEEVRSPLVSLSFYEGGNPVKGFNTFRNWCRVVNDR